MDVRKVDFVCVPTQDAQRAARFYGETLGLKRNPNSSDAWIEFETGNVTIAILPHEYTGRLEFAHNAGPIAFCVDDVAEARAGLEAKGVEFAAETIDSGVCHMAPFSDPDGNALLLHRRYAPFADGTTP